MKKIGIFLEVLPYSGGTFQYCQTYSTRWPHCRATASQWLPAIRRRYGSYLNRYANVKAVHLPLGFCSRTFGLAWLLLRLPMGLWRKICPLFHPMARAMLREECDLWIFPSHTTRSFPGYCQPWWLSSTQFAYFFGRPFPEAISFWELLNRVPTYSNICRWSRGLLVVSGNEQQVIDAYHMLEDQIDVLPMVPPRYIFSTEVPENFDWDLDCL